MHNDLFKVNTLAFTKPLEVGRTQQIQIRAGLIFLSEKEILYHSLADFTLKHYG